jgi:hypothetical protein
MPAKSQGIGPIYFSAQGIWALLMGKSRRNRIQGIKMKFKKENDDDRAIDISKRFVIRERIARWPVSSFGGIFVRG